jgi:hypothetical protein
MSAKCGYRTLKLFAKILHKTSSSRDWSKSNICAFLIDASTIPPNIIETGDESYRFRRTLAKKGGKA